MGPWVCNTKAAKQLLSSWGLDLQQHTGFPLKHITHCGAVLQCSAEIKGTQAKVDGVNSTSSCGFLNSSTVYYFANASKKQPRRTWKSNRIHLMLFIDVHWCSLIVLLLSSFTKIPGAKVISREDISLAAAVKKTLRTETRRWHYMCLMHARFFVVR